MTKIKSFDIKGLRGIKSNLPLNIDGKSILLYGDNGTGKSSISDAFEWFFYDRIEHLSSEEIGRGGIAALRNVFLRDDEKAFISIEFTEEKFNSCKTIYLKKGSYAFEISNTSNEFDEFLDDSKNENIILRYKDLMNFVLAPKSEKLTELSNIIGFSDVITTKDVLRKITNELKKDIKSQKFDYQISTQQAHFIEYFGHNIISDKQFIDSINELIKSLNINKELTKLDEIDTILTLIKEPDDSKIIELQTFYTKINDSISNLSDKLDEIENSYKEYYNQLRKIITDFDKINKIELEELLSVGVDVIKRNIVTDNKCPLCLEPKNKAELLKELEFRINELEKYKKEKLILIGSKKSLQKVLSESNQILKVLLTSDSKSLSDNIELKVKLEQLKTCFGNYLAELDIEISEIQKLGMVNEFIIDRNLFNQIIDFCKQKNIELNLSKKDNLKFDIHSKIVLSRNAYDEIRILKKEKETLENQKTSLDLIYSEFVKKQKESLESFLSYFSGDVNDLYQFMHPDEKVEDIKLVPLEKDDELTGLTFKFNFFENEVTPPHKYLSESHLNCFGIAFFLTSVKAFNKKNKFFILDDVISSLDTRHRKRFGDLLIEKFPDYQIILLTHEKNWFDIVKNLVKGKNWKVNTVKWNEERGTYIDEPFESLKERIERKIKANDENGLGNDCRKYIEHRLKDIAFNLEVKVKFVYNDTNEDRMAYELLTELKSKINNQPSQLKNSAILNRLLKSLFLGNKDSHDCSFVVSIDDIKAFWKDVKDLNDLFYCSSCQKFISLKYYDDVGKKIRCGCGSKIYEWNK